MVYLYIPVRTPESFQKEGWLTPIEIYKLDKFLKEQEQKKERGRRISVLFYYVSM